MKQYDFMKDPDANGSDSISVEHTPKRKLDLFPRIACIIIALGIWIYMVNMNDADMTETITLRIELAGVETLESEGMMVYGLGERTVTVTVKGTNRDLKQHSESDYKATVEVGGITEAKPMNLPINVKVPENTSITVEAPGSVLIYADYKMEAEVKTRVVFGAANGEDFNWVSDKEYIKISGPKSIVDKIAVIELKVDGELSDGTAVDSFSSVKYYDKFNDEIDTMNSVTVLTEDFSGTVEVKTDASAESDAEVTE